MEFSEGEGQGQLVTSDVAVFRIPASAVQDDLIQHLAQNLVALDRAAITHNLGFLETVEFVQGLREWCSRPDSTVFILHSELASVGRTDLAQKLLGRMQSIPLHVVVVEACPTACTTNGAHTNTPASPSTSTSPTHDLQFKRIMTSSEAQLSTALRDALGPDLSAFQIVGPGPWVSWTTKAGQLRGKQLTLQRCSNPRWKTLQGPYGNNSCLMSNTKGFNMDKSKINPSSHCQTKSSQMYDSDETFLKETDNRPHNLNIQLEMQRHDMENAAMMEIQKPMEPSMSFPPVSNDLNYTVSLSHSPYPATPDTDDSLDGHCPSYPGQSHTITSVEDEFTLDENTGVKIPMTTHNNNDNSKSSLQNSAHTEKDASHSSPMNEYPLQIHNTVDSSITDNTQDGDMVPMILFSNLATDSISNQMGHFNNLNSSSQTKIKDISYEKNESLMKEEISPKDLFKNTVHLSKLEVDFDGNKSVDETMDVDSAVSSTFTSTISSPGIVTGATASRSMVNSPEVLAEKIPFGGLSPSEYVPLHFVTGKQWSTTAENDRSSSQSNFSDNLNLSSSSNSHNDGDSKVSQNNTTHMHWNYDHQFIVSSNGQALFQGQKINFSAGQPAPNPLADMSNNLASPQVPKQPVAVPQYFHGQTHRVEDTHSYHPGSKPDPSYLVHTPFSSEENLNNSEPPDYLDVMHYKSRMNMMGGNVSAVDNAPAPIMHTSHGNRSGNVQSCAQMRNLETNNPLVFQNQMVFPNSNTQMSRLDNKPFHSPGTSRRPLPNVTVAPQILSPNISRAVTQNPNLQYPNNSDEQQETDCYLTICDPPSEERVRRTMTKSQLQRQQQLQQQQQIQQLQQQQQQRKQPQSRSQITQTQPNGSVMSEDMTAYNYIDSRKVASMPGTNRVPHVPLPPPRRVSQSRTMSLEEQLTRLEGWCAEETDHTIEKTMEDYRCQDGYYIVWKSTEKNRFVITVSHRHVLHHFLVEEERESISHDKMYFIWRQGFRSKNFLELVNHYILSGIKQPLVDERLGKAYVCISIRLECPLKVRFVRKRKTHAR